MPVPISLPVLALATLVLTLVPAVAAPASPPDGAVTEPAPAEGVPPAARPEEPPEAPGQAQDGSPQPSGQPPDRPDAGAAAEPPPARQPEPPPPTPDQAFSGRPSPQAAPSKEEHTWFDASRSFVGRMFFAPIVRMDRFFSDEIDLDPERARSFARFRTGVHLRQDGTPLYLLDFYADVRIPGVNRWLNRVRLVVAGTSDDESSGGNLEGGTPTPFNPGENRAGLELRYGAYRGVHSALDLGAGFLFQLPPGAFVRARHRVSAPVDDLLLAKLSTQVFYRTDMKLGTRANGTLDWPVTPRSMVRLGAAGEVAQEKTHGLEYGTELVYSYAFSVRSAVALGTEAQGDTQTPAPTGFERYRIYTRYRQGLLRSWLFLELEPEVAWPWTADRGRYRAYGVFLRLEVQFQGEEAVESQAAKRAASKTPDDEGD